MYKKKIVFAKKLIFFAGNNFRDGPLRDFSRELTFVNGLLQDISGE